MKLKNRRAFPAAFSLNNTMEELTILFKVTVLSLLSHSKLTLTGSQISAFFQEYEYTDYLKSQFTIGDLLDTGLIAFEEGGSGTHLTLTVAGEKTLASFSDRISPEIEKDIRDYLKRHSIAIRENHDITAYYDRDVRGGYLCNLKAVENDKTVFSCLLSVPTEAQAENICLNFRERYQDVYISLLDELSS